MAELVWDDLADRTYETGVDHGVLYVPNEGGDYDSGVAWNGLTTVTEKPSGAESNPQYADNIMYLNLLSAEQFGATIEALTYPPEFAQFDGLASPSAGVMIGQQGRGHFGLAYRTKFGNALQGDDAGYKLHLVYGALASPSEKAYNTVNDSPEPIAFSWDISTTPVAVPGMKPTSIITIDSTLVDAANLAALEEILFGTEGTDARLPLPAEVLGIFAGGIIEVAPVEPAYNAVTHTITIPVTAGVTYYIDGAPVPAGDVVIADDTMVTARANAGYSFEDDVDDDWFYNY